MEFANLLYQREGARAVLVLNRPARRNALSPGLIADLHAALQAADEDPDVRTVVLTGAGDRAFCAGGDLGGGMMQQGVLAAHQARAAFAELFTRLAALRKPVIAKVQGDALGGGFGLMLGCDLVVMAEEARFGTPEIRLGLFPHIILAVIVRNLGRKAATELVLTGDKLPASRALELGVANRVVPRAELDEATDALCDRLEAHSPAILALGRRALYDTADLPLPAALNHLNAQLTINTLAEDAMEGVAAFLQKRAPEWKGR